MILVCALISRTVIDLKETLTLIVTWYPGIMNKLEYSTIQQKN